MWRVEHSHGPNINFRTPQSCLFCNQNYNWIPVRTEIISQNGFDDNDCASCGRLAAGGNDAGRRTSMFNWISLSLANFSIPFGIFPISFTWCLFFLFQSGKSVLEYQNQAKLLFRKLGVHSPPRCTIETGPYLFQWVEYFFQLTKVSVFVRKILESSIDTHLFSNDWFFFQLFNREWGLLFGDVW